jgi:NUMOD4 motif/HNH endonuclease
VCLLRPAENEIISGTECVEEWRSIPGFPEYEVSNLGRVKSLSRISRRKRNGFTTKEKLLKGNIQTLEQRKRAYRRVRVTLTDRDGKRHYEKVAHLVLMAFVGPKPAGMWSLHGDGNSLNNTLDNLRWGTAKENRADSVRHETATRPPRLIGENHPNTHLRREDIEEIRSFRKTHGVLAKLARRFSTSSTTILRIRQNKVWREQ